MNQSLRISVIIPTLNRPEAIERLVRQFLEQAYPDFEVIIVDQSDSANTSLESLATIDRRVKYIYSNVKGTCRSRNLGVAGATGDVYLFVDDDSELIDRHLLAIHAENYNDPTIAGIGGRVEDKNIQLNKESNGPVCWVSPDGRVYPNASGHERKIINAPRGGHMSFRASVVQAVGGFDEQFIGNAMREETDFSLRVIEAGNTIMFEPRATVIHLGLPSGGSRQTDRRTWYEDFFANELYFLLKHFSRQYLPLFYYRKLRAILACMFYYGYGRPAWIKTPGRGFASARRRYEALRERK